MQQRHSKKYLTLLLLPVLSGYISSLFAADPFFTEDDLFAYIPVVSAVSRFEQRLEQAPASVTIIDRELIALSGALSFVDIFRLIPGFQAYHVGNNRSGISYHGIGREFPNQMEVMVDGRSVYESIFSSVNWGTLGIELADIDYIEVVRGSNAPSQGSNAFLGSVNIITRKPVQNSGLTLRMTAGDIGTKNASLRYNNHFGPLDYRLSLGYKNNNGFPAVKGEGRLEDGRELFHGNFRGTYTPNIRDTVEIFLGYAHDRQGWGDSDHPDEFSLAKFNSHFQSVIWTHSYSSENEIQLHAYHNRFKATNFEPLGPFYSLLGLDKATADFVSGFDRIPQAIVDNFSQSIGLDSANTLSLLKELNSEIIAGFGLLKSERYDIQLQQNFRLSNRLRGVWGLGVRRESLLSTHPHLLDNKVDEMYYRFFTHGEWQLNSFLTLNAGTMIENSFIGTLVSPRVAANIQLTPNHAVRFAYAYGNRAPSLLEANESNVARVGDVIFNILRITDPELEEEHIKSYEFGYMLHLTKPSLNFDVRLFNEKITHVIDEVLEPTAPPLSLFDNSIKRIENSGYWEINGAEIQLSYKPTNSTLVRLHYTNTDMDSRMLRSRAPEMIYHDKDDRLARHSAGLLIGHRFSEHISASIFTYYQSDLRWEDGAHLDAITRVDAQLTYNVSVGNTDVRFKLLAQNLGADYSEFNDNNIFNSRFYLITEIDFH